ncbi:MAG: SipW-dependent-type signal peptide-containing protein [Firmicutes bacterium]|nr:SipW-dependent-type signal peptide-containing protein [Bacillota bacterium]
MSEKKSLKTALLLSILMLLICVASMVGATMAWFTDSVASERNQIKVGSLDVDLEFSHDGKNWHTVQGTTRLFKENKQMMPGTSQMVFLRIQNEGSLHLKYQFSLNIIEELESTNVLGNTFRMSEYMKVGVLDRTALKQMMDAQPGGGSLEEIMQSYEEAPQGFAQTRATIRFCDAVNLLQPGIAGFDQQTGKPLTEDFLGPKDAHIFALIIYTPAELDEQINHEEGYNGPQIKFGIDVVAGQRSGSGAESDSFGTDYDNEAIYPETISSQMKKGN